MKKLLLSLTVFAGLSATAQVYFQEDFTAPGAWTVLNNDTDTLNWSFGSVVATNPLSTQGTFAISNSWTTANGALTPDNLLFSPVINLTSATGTINMTFKVGSPEPTDPAPNDFYQEYISVYATDGFTGLPAALAAAPIHGAALTAGQQMFTFTYPISSFAGADSLILVFRHHNCTDENFIVLDDINVSGTNGINENVISASVYPNPAKDVINFEVAGNIATVEITTLEGKSVISSTDKTVSIADLKTGLYLYTITTAEGKIAKGNFTKN
ncbi:MAG: T9SS type A sorting domain-containing protein [Fluviicola sp.]